MGGITGWEIGVDIGGTFTDVVARAPGEEIRFFKLPTTRSDPSQGVVAALQQMKLEWQLQANTVFKFARLTFSSTRSPST